MRGLKRVFLFFTVFLCGFDYSGAYAQQTADELIKEMFASVDKIKSLEYVQWKRERIEGKLMEQQLFVKFHKKPFKLYVKKLPPEDPQEVLFEENQRNNHALINPASFPYINLTLDPKESLMRDNQHHTLYESGFDYMINILKFLLNKYGEASKKYVSVKGSTVWRGRECYEIEMKNPRFGYKSYTVQNGEDITKIADRLMISDVMVVELNPEVDDFSDVSPGQKIKIPEDYAASMVIYLDKKLLLPLVIRVFDDKGLFAEYEYREIKVNPVFYKEDFSEFNKAYKFH